MRDHAAEYRRAIAKHIIDTTRAIAAAREQLTEAERELAYWREEEAENAE